MPDICQGQIVWVPVADHNDRNCYDRPVIILTPTDEIAEAAQLYGVVASHTAAKRSPLPNHYVPVPFNAHGFCSTNLRKATVAVCEWVVPVKKREIILENVGGVVPPRILEEIVRTCEAIARGKLRP